MEKYYEKGDKCLSSALSIDFTSCLWIKLKETRRGVRSKLLLKRFWISQKWLKLCEIWEKWFKLPKQRKIWEEWPRNCAKYGRNGWNCRQSGEKTSELLTETLESAAAFVTTIKGHLRRWATVSTWKGVSSSQSLQHGASTSNVNCVTNIHFPELILRYW